MESKPEHASNKNASYIVNEQAHELERKHMNLNLERMKQLMDEYKDVRSAEELPLDISDEITNFHLDALMLKQENPVMTYNQAIGIHTFISWSESLGDDLRSHLQLVK